MKYSILGSILTLSRNIDDPSTRSSGIRADVYSDVMSNIWRPFGYLSDHISGCNIGAPSYHLCFECLKMSYNIVSIFRGFTYFL